MTVISAPRMTPRSVSSLIMPPAPVSARLAILFSLDIEACAGRGRRRMAADRLPPAVVPDPPVGEPDAILDQPPEIFEPPAGVDGADHHLRQNRCILDFDVDLEHVAALDGFEPFVARHHERARRARPDQHEILMHKRLQPLHVLAAQRIAPFALEPFDHRTLRFGHWLRLSPRAFLMPNSDKANLRFIAI